LENQAKILQSKDFEFEFLGDFSMNPSVIQKKVDFSMKNNDFINNKKDFTKLETSNHHAILHHKSSSTFNMKNLKNS